MSTQQKAATEHHEVVSIHDVEKGHGHGHGHDQGKKVANPAAIGFGAFALCSFVMALYNSGKVTDVPQVALGIAFGVGAFGQGVAGISELVMGNTFAATTMLTYSGFWISFGVMFASGSGFLEAATAGGMESLEKCLGLWQIAFAIPSFFFFLGTLKQPWLIRLTLIQVFFTFLFGGLGAFTGVSGLTQAGGWVSFTLAITAWYVMCAIIFEPDHTYIRLPFF